MDVTKPVGGRGHVAPYTSSVIRVPDPLIPDIELMVNKYREKVILGISDTGNSDTDKLSDNDSFGKSKDELIDLAYKVLKGRKNARISLQKLLQLICDDLTIKL